MMEKLLHCLIVQSGVIGLIIGFTQDSFSQVRNKHTGF